MVEDSELYRKIKGDCFKYLSYREYSQLELANKLLRKGWSETQIQEVLTELVKDGSQCNQRFAESFTRQRIQKGYGPIKISYELKQRGIEKIDLSAIVAEVSGSWQDLLEQVYLHKYSADVEMEKQEWSRRQRFLLQRGFSSAMISQLYRQLRIQV